MSFPYMPWYHGDHIRDTGHLTTEQHGAYFLLINHYWSTGGLPDDDCQLAAIAKLTVAKWRKMRSVIQAFFHEDWKHKRIDAELEKANAKSAKRQEAANKRWQKTDANAHAKASANAMQMDMQTGSGSGSGSSNYSESDKCSEGCSDKDRFTDSLNHSYPSDQPDTVIAFPRTNGRAA
jgi:uncharacterized protein YdaU (DUF1376 family)